MSCFFDAIFVRLTPEWKEKVGSSSAVILAMKPSIGELVAQIADRALLFAIQH